MNGAKPSEAEKYRQVRELANELQRSFSEYARQVNTVVAPLLVGLMLACLSLDKHRLVGLVITCAFALLLCWYVAANLHPISVRYNKLTSTESGRMALKELEWQFGGVWGKLRHFWLFDLSIVFFLVGVGVVWFS